MSADKPKRKTPKDATEFEREQLRHLLSASDHLAVTLAEINPSLAWLSLFGEMKLIQSGTQLAPWVQKNFAEIDAIKDVAANLRFFTPEAADFLEHGLNRDAGALTPLQLLCWRLIIRSLREAKRGGFPEWFDLAPRVKRGDYSHEVLDRLAALLRPKLTIRGKPDWHSARDEKEPFRPSDLMSIEYTVGDLTGQEDVLAAWSETAPAEVDARLLSVLTDALDQALADATEAGVEGEGHSISDSDVPSVADHSQNEYHEGFMLIVRVIADLWTRVAGKDPALAIEAVNRWSHSDFKLERRLALYAACNCIVPPATAISTLKALPLSQLFFGSSSVEIFRLLRTRWTDFSEGQRVYIEGQIKKGPPTSQFREGADVRDLVDRSQFDLLGDLERRGLELSDSSITLLNDIRARHPQWQLREAEQAGFQIWMGEVHSVTGDPDTFDNVSDEDLLDRAEEIQAKDEFQQDAWTGLCQSDPQRALRGLAAAANKGKWPSHAWQSFLWSAPKLGDPPEVSSIGSLLQEMPDEVLNEIAPVASFWMNDKSKEIEDSLLWPLWDRLLAMTNNGADVNLTMRDVFTDALNAPGGRLAEVVLKKLARVDTGTEIAPDMQSRLERLIRAGGQFGLLARTRLTADVSFLFDMAPQWTTQNIAPLFRWSSADAFSAWSARKYSRHIGSQKLMELLKEPFLQLFSRPDVPDEDIRSYADWLAAIMLANQTETASYPITATEARAALRKTGLKALSSFGHRLAIEMQRASDESKSLKWHKIVGPVFSNVWPLDAELQTPASTFKLVQILVATGAAFGDAAETIVPFVRPEESRANTTVFSISRASEIIYQTAPDKLLDLLDAVVGDSPARSVHGLNKALDRLKAAKPSLATTRKFQHLASAAVNY